jgi:hypothetical protein
MLSEGAWGCFCDAEESQMGERNVLGRNAHRCVISAELIFLRSQESALRGNTPRGIRASKQFISGFLAQLFFRVEKFGARFLADEKPRWVDHLS